jgi:hypothetical protein
MYAFLDTDKILLFSHSNCLIYCKDGEKWLKTLKGFAVVRNIMHKNLSPKYFCRFFLFVGEAKAAISGFFAFWLIG